METRLFTKRNANDNFANSSPKKNERNSVFLPTNSGVVEFNKIKELSLGLKILHNKLQKLESFNRAFF